MSHYFHSFLAFWLPKADREQTLERQLTLALQDRLEARIACACAEAVVEELEVELQRLRGQEEHGVPPIPEVRHLTPFQGVDTGRFPRG